MEGSYCKPNLTYHTGEAEENSNKMHKLMHVFEMYSLKMLSVAKVT